MLRALGCVSCDITHETGGTICYGHSVLCLMTSHMRQGVRFVTGIGFCVLSYHTRDRGYDLLRALGSTSCDIRHETGGTICSGHSVLRLVISHTRQGYDLLRALGSASCDITHETRGTICYGHWVLRLVISHTRQGVRFVTGIGFWDNTHETGGTICYGHWLLRLGLELYPSAKKYDLLRETGGTICYGHWVLRLVISHTRQGVRFVTGIGFCVL